MAALQASDTIISGFGGEPKIILDLTDGLAGPANPRHLATANAAAPPPAADPTTGQSPTVKIELELDGNAYAGRLYTASQPASG